MTGSHQAKGTVMGSLDKPPTQRFWLVVITLIAVVVIGFFVVKYYTEQAQLRQTCQAQPYSTACNGP